MIRASASSVSSGKARSPARAQASSTNSRTARRSVPRTPSMVGLTLPRGRVSDAPCGGGTGREERDEGRRPARADRGGAPVEAVGGGLHGGGRRGRNRAVVVRHVDGGPGLSVGRRECDRGDCGSEDAGGVR